MKTELILYLEGEVGNTYRLPIEIDDKVFKHFIFGLI